MSFKGLGGPLSGGSGSGITITAVTSSPYTVPSASGWAIYTIYGREVRAFFRIDNDITQFGNQTNFSMIW